MIIQVLHCPNCQGTDIVRHGKTRQGKQRDRCREKSCAGRTFLLEFAYAGRSPAVKQQIVDMAMNASGIRDTASVLHIIPNTVLAELKKGTCAGAEELDDRRGLTSELDEMWSYVRSKANPRWLWHAIDHHSGQVLAYTFGRQQATVFLQLPGFSAKYPPVHVLRKGP